MKACLAPLSYFLEVGRNCIFQSFVSHRIIQLQLQSTFRLAYAFTATCVMRMCVDIVRVCVCIYTCTHAQIISSTSKMVFLSRTFSQLSKALTKFFLFKKSLIHICYQEILTEKKRSKDFHSMKPETNLKSKIDGLYMVYITIICI